MQLEFAIGAGIFPCYLKSHFEPCKMILTFVAVDSIRAVQRHFNVAVCSSNVGNTEIRD